MLETTDQTIPPALHARPLAAQPLWLGSGSGACFGWFHPAQGSSRGMGVVLCRPMGHEAHLSYTTYTVLAERLAQAGFAVLRFDYHGTGDSAGADTDTDRVRAWLDSIKRACAAVRKRGAVSHLGLFGMRLGATLAAQAAVELGGVDSLALWAPCQTGRAFTRELQASMRSRATHESAADGILAMAYTYTAQTLSDLATLDALALVKAPAKRALIIGRDDIPVEGQLPTLWRSLGTDVTYTVLPGFAGMMVEVAPNPGEPATLNQIVAWFEASPAALVQPGAVVAGLPEPLAPLLLGPIRESPVHFGPNQRLFGILTESTARSQQAHWRADTALLLITVSFNHHIGPNRIYTTLARAWSTAGFRTLRFDLEGIGDSRPEGEHSDAQTYWLPAVQSVQCAIDVLATLGCRHFILLGLCSGAFPAFQTALVDTRINGTVLLNPRRLSQQQDDTLVATLQTGIYQSTGYYWRALFKPDMYRRLLLGKIDVGGIARRLLGLLGARLQRVWNGITKSKPDPDDPFALVRSLGQRGVDTLMIVSEFDDGLDYVEFHFGSKGCRMKDQTHFKLVFVEDSDHTFTSNKCLQFVQDTVVSRLDELSRRWEAVQLLE